MAWLRMSATRNDREVVARLLQHARRAWPQLGLITLLNLLSAPLALLLPVPLKIAVDSVIGGEPLPGWLARLAPAPPDSAALKLLGAVALLLGIALLTHLQQLSLWLLQTWTGERIVNDFRSRLFWHAQRLSLTFHQRAGMSEVAYRIQNDAPAIQSVLIQGIVPAITAAVTLGAMLAVTAALDWRFGLIGVAIAPALFFLSLRSSRRARPRWKQVKELDTLAMSSMHEALSGVQVVKAFGQEAREERRFAEHSEARMEQQVRLASVQALYHVLMGLTIALGSAAALYVGVREVQQGTLTLGTLLLAMSYLVQIHEPLRMLSSKLPELQGALTSAERALELLNEPVEAPRAPAAEMKVERVRGRIEFRGVSFSYTPERRTLEGVSFVVEPGTNVGIIGPTGAGKSTLIALLTRFHEPAAGAILLDGVDLRDYSLAGLRAQFAIVLQEPLLFSTTIAENIAYGDPGATADEIVAAARAANAHDFIARLPEGYNSRLGPRGIRLSGGERQRISLARAFLKDAPILVMDEPTSAVDARTEAVILEATEALMRGRTTFVIAHRLNTLEKCDVIFSLREGELVSVAQNVPEVLHAAAEAQADSMERDRHMAELLR